MRAKMHWLPPILALALVFGLVWTAGQADGYSLISRWGGNSVSFQTGSITLSSSPFPASTPSLVTSASVLWSQSSTGVPFSINDYNCCYGPTRMYVDGGNFGSLGYPDVPGVNQLGFLSSGYLQFSHLYLNSTWSWNTSCYLNQGAKQVDVMTIVLHEMGHSVALNHDPSHTEAVMWPNYACKQTLRTDDVNGIDALY